MGKGSNVAKAQAARERNAKDATKTPEERAAAKKKADADKQANKCLVCLQTFMINAKNELLFEHITARHDKMVREPEKCFPKLKGYDPTKPAIAVPVAKTIVKKPAARKNDEVNDLLAAGLAGARKKK